MKFNLKYDKLQNVCYRLNYEASQQKQRWTSTGRGKNRRHVFSPCEKANVIIEALGKHESKDLPIVEIMIEAYNTYCSCHGHAFIPFHEFQSWQLDDRYKLAHYNRKEVKHD